MYTRRSKIHTRGRECGRGEVEFRGQEEEEQNYDVQERRRNITMMYKMQRGAEK